MNARAASSCRGRTLLFPFVVSALLQPSFLVGSASVYAVEASACPPAPDDAVFREAAASAPIDLHKEALLLSPRDASQDEKRKTYVFPSSGKDWLSARGSATICWSYGVGACPAIGPCVVNLGVMYWRGPRPQADADIAEICHSSTGCLLRITGLNLQMMDHSYSRLALLNSCGKPEGPGLLEVDRYPPGYVVETPSQQLENLFVPDIGLEPGRTRVHVCLGPSNYALSRHLWPPPDSYAVRDKYVPRTSSPFLEKKATFSVFLGCFLPTSGVP